MSQAGSFNTGVFPPGSVVQTLTGNSGGPVGPNGANNINVVGSGSVTVAGNPGTNTLTISVSGAVSDSFPTDSGTATPAGGILNVFGGTAGRDINTSGSGNTIHIDLNNAITLGDLAAIGAGSNALSATTGDINIAAGNLKLPTTASANVGVIEVNSARFIHSFGGTNTFVGNQTGNFTLTGFSSTAIGAQSLSSLTSGAFNTAGGFVALNSVTSGGNNASWGAGSLGALTTSSSNSAFGNSALNSLITGSNNIAVGLAAGSSYTTNESNNIVIGTVGVVADSGAIRIGTSGTNTSAFITGIDGVNVGSTAKVVTLGTAGTVNQLGTATITAGSGITVTPSANTITIAATGTTTLTYTNVNTTPYVVLSTDEFLSVDTSALAITIQLPNAATLGRVFVIKDRTGAAATRNITVTTVGGAVNIDGATTFVMNTNFQSIQVIGNGSTYEIF